MTDVQKIWLTTKLDLEKKESESKGRIERLKSKVAGRSR